MHNLANSGIAPDELLAKLRNTSTYSQASQAAFGAALPQQWLLDSLFRSVQLLPVRRPHASDEVRLPSQPALDDAARSLTDAWPVMQVVANLDKYEATTLSTEYLSDALLLSS